MSSSAHGRSFDNNSMSENKLQNLERIYEKDKIKQLRDDRSAIQKKTFTKWINTYLIKVGQSVDDLYIDLGDGNRLVTLLEILTGQRLPRERGKMRFHKLQNVENSLNLLKRKNIKLVNIRNDDIVDGNPKLILGLIWTIILNFEISHDPEGQASAKATLIDWAKRATRGYNGVEVRNFTSSFRNGMAFNAIIHRFRPDIIDYDKLKPENAEENLEHAFSVAENELGIPRLLDVEDFVLDELDEKSIMTYLSAFNRMYSKVPTEEELAVKVYSDRINVDARKIMSWIKSNIDRLEKKVYKMDPDMFEKYKEDLRRVQEDELPEKKELKDYLGDCYKNLKQAEAEDMITTDITFGKIEKFWDILEKCLADKTAALQAEKDRIQAQDDLADRIQKKAEQAAKTLDHIKRMILNPEEGTDLGQLIQEAKQIIYNSNMEEDTRAMFSGVSALVKENHPRAEDLSKEVQLISDELDEIKVRIDTLHDNIEQSAVDQIEAKLDDLLSIIRQNNEELEKEGYGEDLQSSLRVLDKLLQTMDQIDNLHYEIASMKSLVEETPRTDLKQEAKLQTVNHEYALLKANCVSKDQDLREGVEFLEAIEELAKWGQAAKQKELKFDWAEFDPQNMPYEKGIAKQQKKFDQVLVLGKQLIKTEHPMSHIISAEVEELCSLWTCLKDLACVAEKHLQHHNDYELFRKRLKNANMWITQKRNLLDTRYNAKCLDVVSSSERLQELVDMKKDIVGYDPNIVQIADLGKVVICLSKRKKPQSGEKLKALCSFRRSGSTEALITRGEECQYISGMNEWRVKKFPPLPKSNNHNGHHSPSGYNTSQTNGPSSGGLVAEAPSCIFTTLPPDPECLQESERTTHDYEELKLSYDRQRAYLKHIMLKHEFFSNCDVVLTWPYDKHFDAELRGRELVISNLKETGEFLTLEADAHPSSDKADVAARERAALDHWQDLLEKHKTKCSAAEELQRRVGNLAGDVEELGEQCAGVGVDSNNVDTSQSKLEKIRRDVVAMKGYLEELQLKADDAAEQTCGDDFKPISEKLDRLKASIVQLQASCEDKIDCASRLEQLQDLILSVTAKLDGIITTLAEMQVYPLQVEVVTEQINKLQLISEDLVSQDEDVCEIDELQAGLGELLQNSPLLEAVENILKKSSLISGEIDDRSEVLKSCSEPAISQYESTIAHALHWLEDAEEKLRQEQVQPSFKDKYQLLTGLKSDVSLKGCLFEDLTAAQESVISSTNKYQGLLEDFRGVFPGVSPPATPPASSAKELARREGDSVHDQYQRIKQDVDRLIVINEEKYKRYERLKEELELFLAWCSATKEKLSNPPKVLIQLKEVSRLKAQQQEMIDSIAEKGKDLGAIRAEVTDFVTRTEGEDAGEDSAEDEVEGRGKENEDLNEKLKLVQEEYTLILKAAKHASQDLQETMDRVEKVVYWYNCLQQYLKNSRKRLENLDPVATDVVDVAKQLKHCKAITTELESKEALIEEMMRESEYLLSLADNDHLYIIPADLGDKVTSFKTDWKKFCTKCRSQEKRLERTYTKLRKLEAALEKILRWQVEKEKELSAAPPISSDPSIIKEQLDQIKSLRAIVDGCETHITTANELARSLINKGKHGGTESMPPLKVKLEKINDGWKNMDETITQRLYDLESALKRSQGIEKALEDIKGWLDEKEAALKVKDALTISRDELQDMLSKYTELRRDVHGYEGVLGSTTEKALEGLAVDDVDRMREKLDKLKNRYNAIRADADRHQDQVNEVYKALDDLRRNVGTVNSMIDRAKEQANEMGNLATNLPALNTQLKDVSMHLGSIDAIRPDIASLTKEGDGVCDLTLLNAAPKIQREILKLPAAVEKKVASLENAAMKRKKEIEDHIQRLKNVEDSLNRFNDDIARQQKDFDRQSSQTNLDPEIKRALIMDFEKSLKDLENSLGKINLEVNAILSDTDDTPFLKRRVQEAKQKLEQFSLALKSGKDAADTMDGALKKHAADRIALLDELLLLDDDVEGLDPISVNVAAATAQTLQTMNLSEKCDSLRRTLEEMDEPLEDLAGSIPPETKGKMEADRVKATETLKKVAEKLQARGAALDGVLPFITHLQDLETELLPWMDDMTTWITAESAKPLHSREDIKAKIATIGNLLWKIDAQKIDVDDVALFGESALELVTSYDKDTMCDSALELSAHLQDVQERYASLKGQLDGLSTDLNDREALAQNLDEINQGFDKIKDYVANLPQPRLVETGLKQYMSDIDAQLGDIHVLEDHIRNLNDQFPFAAADPEVSALLEDLKAVKQQLDDKKDDLRDKCDMLDALSADISDINIAIKAIAPQTNTVPVIDIKSVEENERYQEELVPRISSLENKLEKLEEVHKRISKDCNPADVKKLEAKIDDLKLKCKEKEQKKNEKMEELKKTKEALQKFDWDTQNLGTWLENQINDLKNQEPPSLSTDVLKDQLNNHNKFTDDVQDKGKDLFKDLLKGAHVLKNEILHNDKPFNDKISELQRKYDTLLNDTATRQQVLESAMLDAQNVKDTMDYILPWLVEAEHDLMTAEKPGADIETVTVQVDKHKADYQQLLSHAHLIDSIRTQDGLGEDEQEQLQQILDSWDTCNELSGDRKEVLAEAYDHLFAFEKALADLNNFINATEAEILENNDVPLNNVDIVEDMINRHRALQEAILTKSSDVELVNALGENYKSRTDPEQADLLDEALDKMLKKWQWLLGEAAERELALQRARDATAEVNRKASDLLQWLQEQEDYLKNCGPVANTYDDLVMQLDEHKNVHAGFDEHQEDYDNIVILCQDLLTESDDPAVGESLDEQLQDLGHKWDSAVKASMARQRAIEEAIQICHDFQDSVNAILEWLPDAEQALESLEPISDEYEIISEQIQELLQLSYFMADQNTAVEQVCTLGSIREETGPALSSNEAERFVEMKTRYKELWNKIGARQDELNAKQDALEADEDMANFDLTEWKKRFLRWMDGNHERIIDLFRKFDVNKDGTLSHQEFKDGILQAGIPTPRSCFPIIIKEFDRDDSGDINYREFAAALKRYEFKPKTEGEHIDYEVQRAVDRCSCRRRFNCVQVGEAKYRFGNMQKLYLVRILSTVVMVRVGGGWQPLHEFLQKYDPCRAKGRTNVDLGKVPLKKDGSGRVISPLKFLSKFQPSGSTPRSGAPIKSYQAGASRDRNPASPGSACMSAGCRQSASTEFDGLDVEHDGVKVNFPGYKVKGGYVSPYSCAALGLKKRSGSSNSLCSTGSNENENTPVRRSPSKGGMERSNSRNSVLSKSSSRGSLNGGRGTFGTSSRRLTTTPVRSNSKTNLGPPRSGSRTDLSRPRTSPSPTTPRTPAPTTNRTQSLVRSAPATSTPVRRATNAASAAKAFRQAGATAPARRATRDPTISPTAGDTPARKSAARPSTAATPVRQRAGAVSNKSTPKSSLSRRGTSPLLASSTRSPVTSPTGTRPVTSPTGARPVISPTGARPVTSPTGARPTAPRSKIPPPRQNSDKTLNNQTDRV